MDCEKLTRAEAVKIVGEEWVKLVNQENAEFIRKSNGVEIWHAARLFGNVIAYEDEVFRGIVAVYYQADTADINQEDLDGLTWKVDHYELFY